MIWIAAIAVLLPAAAQTTKEWGESEGWVVTESADACVLHTGWEGTAIDMSLTYRLGDPAVGIVISTGKLEADRPNQRPRVLTLRLDGKQQKVFYVRPSVAGKAGYDLVADEAILKALAGASKLDIYMDGRPILSLNVAGSREAIALLRRCTTGKSAIGPSRQIPK